jgi:hypothetical protein
LEDHNAGRCPHTARYRPWRLHVTIELPDEQRAVDLERYLKSGVRSRICEATLRVTERPFDQLPVRPRPQDSQRTKRRRKSGARC